jgi:MOSC domain-containing protein YiiM
MGRVLRIFVAHDKGLPMREVWIGRARVGLGLYPDRYSEGKGAFSGSPRAVIRHVSLIDVEAIRRANLAAEVPFLPEETRRNVLTEGLDLNALVGKAFRLGSRVLMRGVELCDPCDRPGVLAGKKGFKEAFRNMGGLRAEIIVGGRFRRGDPIILM